MANTVVQEITQLGEKDLIKIIVNIGSCNLLYSNDQLFSWHLLQPTTKGLESDDIQVTREALEVSSLSCVSQSIAPFHILYCVTTCYNFGMKISNVLAASHAQKNNLTPFCYSPTCRPSNWQSMSKIDFLTVATF